MLGLVTSMVGRRLPIHREGLGYAMREGMFKTRKRLGRNFQLRVAGGGSQSDRILQILADIFHLPVERTHDRRQYSGNNINM